MDSQSQSGNTFPEISISMFVLFAGVLESGQPQNCPHSCLLPGLELIMNETSGLSLFSFVKNRL